MGEGLSFIIIFFKRRDDLENNSIENIWIEVQSLRNNILLGLFYRPPNATTEYWDAFVHACLRNSMDYKPLFSVPCNSLTIKW